MCSLLTQLYSKNNYNTLISYPNGYTVHNLISANLSQFYNIQLVDGCIYPERSQEISNALKNANGLFGADYDRLSQFVFVQDERCLVYYPDDVEVIGFLPNECRSFFVVNVALERGGEL